MKRLTKLLVLVLGDAFFLTCSFIGACYLVQHPFGWFGARSAIVFFIIVLVQLVVFLKFGLYRAVLRYASIDFLITVLKAVSIAMLAPVMGFYFVQTHIPVQVLLVDWLMAVFFVGGSRFAIRYFFELKQRYQKGRKVLIYGAGDMGALALRQLKLNKDILYSPVGFIDDDRSKNGRVLQGLKVLGSIKDMEYIVNSVHVEEVLVAIAEIDGEKLRDVVKRCRQKNIPCRIIPCFSRLLKVEPGMRNIELADLMRRTPRDMDNEEIQKYLYDKCVLITGAAGSIGSELVLQSLRYDPRKIIALDQSEYGLYALREKLGENNGIHYLLGDISDIESIEHVFKVHRPDIVFHAAAYKHVPMLENNVAEAIRNNIGGTKNLAVLADEYGAMSFVLISTDKAVKPSSIMGATKRVCELFVQNFNRLSKTEYVSVRFGNVLGSSGSVVPKFLEQIKCGGPVTVTHPDATRYFMLIEEAVQLVLQAASIGKGGEIFILNMGNPVRIVEMAEDLIYLMGHHPHKDIKVKYIGLNPGEKIVEELFHDETENPTRFEDITIGRTTELDWKWLNEKIDSLLTFAPGEDMRGTLKFLGELVPEGSFGRFQLDSAVDTSVRPDVFPEKAFSKGERVWT